MSKDEVWRWNTEQTWHYHCSMIYEAEMALAANNDFMKYHHLRSCIYFGISAFEAHLNQIMRRHMENEGASENKIHKKLFNTPMREKRTKWPNIVTGKPFDLPSETDQIFQVYRNIRDEITHPKRRDHSIYQDLDNCVPHDLIDAISIAIVSIYEAQKKPFPYWLLGWNYVGFNFNAADPHQSNNLNGFVYSLQNMNFNAVQTSSPEWERQHMGSVKAFKHLQNELAKFPYDIEPFNAMFPEKPRLTRRWWDHAFIYKNVEEMKELVKQMKKDGIQEL